MGTLDRKKRRADEGQQTGGAANDITPQPIEGQPPGKRRDVAVAPNNILLVKNLPHEDTENWAITYFKVYPGYKEVQMIEEEPGVARVVFDSVFYSEVAMKIQSSVYEEMIITYAPK